MCVVIDLDVVCLICLQPSKEMFRIFTADGDDPELQIAQKISILSELKIDQNNHSLPKKICTKCLQDLKAAWRFRKNCQAAVTIFQTIVNLENVKPESSQTKQLSEQEIKMPHGLQVLLTCISTDNEGVETKKTSDSLILDDEVDSKAPTLYEHVTEDFVEHEDNDDDEFEAVEEVDESEQNQDFENDDDNALVEYYIAEDGASDETTIRIENRLSASTIEEEKQTSIKMHDVEEKQTNLPYMQNASIATMRGKSDTRKEVVKKRNVVQTNTKGTIVIDSANSSQKMTRLEVREVKTRKPLSPERKTPKICEICGNSYRFQHALKAHMRRHYNDKPFPCECCDKAFVSNVELRRHMRVHTGQKPYACQYCDRRFSDFGSRIKHERTHTGERPYHCVTCGKSFAYPHVLSVHVRTHTGEKRFRCDYCTKGFTKKAYLMSHVKQHHSSLSNIQIVVEDTMDKSDSSLKSKTFEECIYNREYINDDEIDADVKYCEDSNEEPVRTISNGALMVPKMEVYDEDEVQVHQ